MPVLSSFFDLLASRGHSTFNLSLSCRLSNFCPLPHFALSVLAIAGPMIVCSRFLSFPPSISFTSANFPRLTGEHITSLTGSLRKTWASLILLLLLLYVFFCSALHLSSTHVSFFLPVSFHYAPFCFPSPILFLTSLFFPHILCQMWFCLFVTSPQGLFCSLLTLSTSLPLPISSSLLPQNKEWNRSFLPSFHHFSLLILPFCPPCGDATTYSSDSSSLQAPFRLLIRGGSEIL